MFKKKKITDSEPVSENYSAEKLSKPKVFLMGLDNSVLVNLEETGINATQGSLGTVYKVDLSSSAEPLRDSSQIKGYAEQEIIFVDLSYQLATEAVGKIYFPEGEPGIWIKRNRGFIDPRSMAAAHVQDGFDRIIEAGGVVVVFASPKTDMSIFGATLRGGALRDSQNIQIDEWSFLSDLKHLTVRKLSGEEITVCDERSPMGKALASEISGMKFECTFPQMYDPHNHWIPLAKNKFGDTIALKKIYPSGGALLILPQILDKSGFIKRLLTNALPEMFPSLFPGIEKGRWTHLPEYELSKVAKLQAEREEKVKRHESEMELIQAGIAMARKADGWLHELLTQTGDPLVEAVVAALKELGFKAVVDMDKIRDRENKPRREDLQIQDISPTLVVDIKGINNFPSDEDTMQAFKHAALIMREEKRFDVFGLSIINHQRHLPPLQRDNSMPFRKELVDVALQNFQGLMTTWDLYRLVVNKRKHLWKAADVNPVLYRYGRIEVVPENYELLGRVTQVWKHAFGVDIENSSVCVGDTIALEFDVYFEESTVESLQVDDGKKLEAASGDKTGIPWPTSSNRPKIGMRVFVAKAVIADTDI